jgi:hypothetical protein
MAQRAERTDWTDRDRIRQRAKDSARSFLSPVRAVPEPERPLSPGLVARVTEPSAEAAPEQGEQNRAGAGEENHEERMVRPTERGRINDAPSTTYPG